MTNIEKYQLRENETYVREYVEDDGTHVTVIKDKNGDEKHGMSIDIPEDLFKLLENNAHRENISLDDYINKTIEQVIMDLIEKEKELQDKRKAIEEISD